MGDPRFKHPFTCIVAGPTGCGKSQFVARLLRTKESTITPVPDRVVFHYAEWQPLYERLENFVEFRQGLPDVDSFDPRQKNLLVLDDAMGVLDKKKIASLFTEKSHHRNLSVIYVVQNLFEKGPESRTVGLNAHYLVVFKNPRDASQISHLARQMYPGRGKYVQEAFARATSKPYGYLLVDARQETPEHLRLRTKIFPGELQVVYVRKV